jgi:hypothetical protein
MKIIDDLYLRLMKEVRATSAWLDTPDISAELHQVAFEMYPCIPSVPCQTDDKKEIRVSK